MTQSNSVINGSNDSARNTAEVNKAPDCFPDGNAQRRRRHAWPEEQPARARWGGARASRRLAQGTDRQPHGTGCLEGHHAFGPQRVHLLGSGCQAGDDQRTPHSPDPGGAGARPASALLLARVQAPRAHPAASSRQCRLGWSTKVNKALADLLKGGRGKRSGGLLRAVDGVFDAEAAEVGETEQRFRAHHHGEIEPQLSQ